MSETVRNIERKHREEERRIDDVYRRRASAVPAGRYGPDDPAEAATRHRREAITRWLLLADGVVLDETSRALDIGTGEGDWLSLASRLGVRPGRAVGLDLLLDRLEAGRARAHDRSLVCGSALSLPFPDGAFSLLNLNTVLSSVLDPELRAHIAAEALRVLSPTGALLLFDIRWNNPRNRQVRAVTLEETRALFPACRVESKTLGFLPPLARQLGRAGMHLPLAMDHAVPFLRSHRLSLVRKPATWKS